MLLKDDNETSEDNEERKLLYEYAKNHVLFLQSAPHDWLFPRCSVTVHHGGAGTTAGKFSFNDSMALALESIPVPGATPKKPASGLMA